MKCWIQIHYLKLSGNAFWQLENGFVVRCNVGYCGKILNCPSRWNFQWALVFSELLKTVYATFLKDCITCFSELYMQSFSVIDLYRIAYEVCMNFRLCIPATSFSKVLEKLKPIDRKVELDKIKSTNAQRTIVPAYIRKYLISSNMLPLVHMRLFSNLICNQKVHMQSASLSPLICKRHYDVNV